jgi:thiamine biosynthesis lipoprotein
MTTLVAKPFKVFDSFYPAVPRCIASFHWLVVAAWLSSLVVSGPGRCAEPEMLVGRGETMGTSYSIKIFDPPTTLSDDWRLLVDKELRAITDQMSTYIDSSEISRFNSSASLEWFPVSDGFATVVSKSLEVSAISEGAFDITVMPLVKAWSFGPGKKRQQPPGDDEIELARQFVGYQNLEARLSPPALRKRIAELTIDLNAIAPGYGVDRIVAILEGMGARNLFVEIGGEVRVTGDKAGKPWTVGIQQPDVAGEVVAVAYPVRDRSIATSGDYRSFFEFEGRRYSHTIDPLTARPVTHQLASVTVLADDCMSADAIATTMSVLGERKGLEFAKRMNWDTLMMVRNPDGMITMLATGAFESAIQSVGNGETDVESNAFLPIAIACCAAFGLVIAAMAIGVMFGRRAISGSCGGLANGPSADGSSSCSLCSNPADACKELRNRMTTNK